RYSATLTVTGDLTYHVEAGNAQSDPHEVTAVTPVALAPDSPTVTVPPPAYARASPDEETIKGPGDLSCLQHGHFAFPFPFTRPPAAARLEWRPGAGTATPLPVALSRDRLSAKLDLPARQTGVYRLVLEAEHGIRTELEGGTLTVKPDLPPAVLKYLGNEDVR